VPGQTPLGPPEKSVLSDRLDSWKEIAAYLKRDVRTVQRWEKNERLPVHRHLHEKQGTVYAFKPEIDEWARGRSLLDEDTEGAAESANNDFRQSASVEPAELDGDAGRTARTKGSGWRWVAILSGAVAIAAGVSYLHSPSRENVLLAVLPFKNLGEAGEQPLVDGFTRETIARLETVQPEQMAVLYLPKKYADVPMQEIRQQFNAGYVLKGDARIEGRSVSIATQLLRLNQGSGLTVWSDEYHGELTEIHRIQADMTAGVAHAVLRLLVKSQPTQPLNTQAYEQYQYGAFFLGKRTTPDLLKSLDYFQKAVQEDPSYAPAFAGLAVANSLLGSAPYTALPPRESFSKAEAAASEALRLDPSLAEAHISLGYALLVYERNYDKARHEFERAIQLRPAYAVARDYYAYYLTAIGDMPKAIEEREMARRLDPVSPLLMTALGEAYYQNRQFGEAIARFQRALELDNSYPVSMINLARTYEQTGKVLEAQGMYQKLLTFAPEDPGLLALLGHAYAVGGESDKARHIETQLERLRSKRYVPALYIAMIWTGLGDRDKAFLWLDQAYEEDCEYLVYLRTEPAADPLRGDPRFDVLLHKLGLGGPTHVSIEVPLEAPTAEKTIDASK
jgi:tetratricopeptide (TPR) repeat protein